MARGKPNSTRVRTRFTVQSGRPSRGRTTSAASSSAQARCRVHHRGAVDVTVLQFRKEAGQNRLIVLVNNPKLDTISLESVESNERPGSDQSALLVS